MKIFKSFSISLLFFRKSQLKLISFSPGEPGLPGSDASYCQCPDRTPTVEKTSAGGYKVRRRLVKHAN